MDELFKIISPVINALGNPETVWYRGHTDSHKLLPSIVKFDNGFENEIAIFNKYINDDLSSDLIGNHSDWLTLIEMHHSYVPTRLLAWTPNLFVSLFCSIIRESNTSSIFILDPIKLNKKSKIGDIINLGENVRLRYEDIYLKRDIVLPKYPICIQEYNNPKVSKIKRVGFTVHNNNLRPLEMQCPDCVKKITLSVEQKKKAKQIISSMEWLKFDIEDNG